MATLQTVHLLCCDDRAPDALSALLPALQHAGLHVYGCDLWVPDARVPRTRNAVWASPPGRLPPFQSRTQPVVPITRVDGIAVPLPDTLALLHERVRELQRGLPEGVGILGVIGEPGPLALALCHVLTVLGRAEDGLCDASLRDLPLIRLGALDLPEPMRALLRDTDHARLLQLTDRTPDTRLRGTLTRRIRDWEYVALADGSPVECAALTPVQGRALTAAIQQPGAPAHALFEAASAPELGWSTELRGDGRCPDRVAARIRTWLRRTRERLEGWRAGGLGALVPRPRTRLVTAPVDIELPEDLPWRSTLAGSQLCLELDRASSRT